MAIILPFQHTRHGSDDDLGGVRRIGAHDAHGVTGVVRMDPVGAEISVRGTGSDNFYVRIVIGRADIGNDVGDDGRRLCGRGGNAQQHAVATAVKKRDKRFIALLSNDPELS